MNISLIGVPINYGCDRDGVQYGPNKLRELGIVSLLESANNDVYDMGNIHIPTHSPEMKYRWHEKMKYLNPIVEVNANLAHSVYCSLSGNSFPIVLGGDHSIGMGSIAGASKFFEELAVIWVDAHGDINDSNSSPTGNIHGMPLAASLGYGHDLTTTIYSQGTKIKPENVYIICARDLDKGEIELAERINLNLYTMKSVREIGLEIVLSEVIEKIRHSSVDGVHLSYDIDVLDSTLVPGTGTPVLDGINLDEGIKILKEILGTGLITSMDFVEFNPIIDDANGSTAKVCLEIFENIGKILK